MIQEEVLTIAQKYLSKIRRVGADNISAICPFHRKADGREERSPSFSMSLSKGVWHCWSCHASGTFQSFLRDVGLPRAVIVNQYGELFEALRKSQPVAAFDPTRPKIIAEEPLPEAILGFFDQCPLYLVETEYAAYLDPDDCVVFSETIIQQYDVGFDEKHSRITFPLRDYLGNLVGISGRTVIGEIPRYKVYDREYSFWGYPNRQTTKKGSVLWNAHRVYPRTFMGSPDQFVLVVEGFRACLWAIQAGIKNTVALLGSDLSVAQKWIFERMGCRIYLMLDNDSAGQKALRGRTDEYGRKWPGIAEELSRSLPVSIVSYEGKQPTKLSPEELCKAVNTAEDYFRWTTRG
jgi:DNA primase